MKTLISIFAVLIAVILVSYFLVDKDQLKIIPDKVVENEFVKLTSPKVNSQVESPLEVRGEARGNWYFEASFPIKLLDANGKEIAMGIAMAEGDWMTTDFVPFKATLNFSMPETSTGTLVLIKDNPSGLPENDNSVQVPIEFSQISSTKMRQVSLFYYNKNKDKDSSGNVLCSVSGLEEVTREIPISLTPVQDTIRLLIKGDLTKEEKSLGISTEFPLSGFELVSANISDNVLTLNFKDPGHMTTGGACRAGILWHQIEATAKQFGDFDSIKFSPEELFQA